MIANTLVHNYFKLMKAGIVSAKRRKNDLQEIATRVMGYLDGILLVMQRAAEQISSGRALEDIDDAGFHLYLARKIRMTVAVERWLCCTPWVTMNTFTFSKKSPRRSACACRS